MPSRKYLLYSLNLLPILLLCCMIHSCNGQENIGNNKHSVSQRQALSHTPNLENNQNDQISQVVRTIMQDSKGNMWFGGEGGVFKYDGQSLIHMDSIKSESGKGITIKDITEDTKGRIWFGHTDGISCYDRDSITNYYETDGLISNDVWCVTADSKGLLWIGTIGGVCTFDGNAFSNFELPEGKVDTTLGISSTKMVHNIFEDSKGVLWFSSNAGLLSYSNNQLTNISQKVGIPTNFINEVFEDQNAKLWISTKDGLYTLKDSKLNNITTDKIEIGKGIGSIAADQDGTIWFVCNQHHLYTYDGKDIIEYQKTADNKGPVIFKIYKDQQDRLWFIGYGGAFRLEHEKFVNVTKNGPW